jgi:deoxyribose-phosphate aldolase
MIQYASKNGASIVDIMVPHSIISNRKYEKFRDDIKNIVELCLSLNIKPRYMFEYRVFNYDTLYKLAQILSTYNIFDIFPSSGYRLDNLYDNILAGAMIQKKVPKSKIIYNANIWNMSQIDQIISIQPYGIRLSSRNSLELLYKKYTELKSLG